MLSVVVDRIEGQWAVVLIEGETQPVNIRLADLPPDVKEGDYLRIDHKAKAEAQKRIQARLERLRRGDHLTITTSIAMNGEMDD